MVGSGPAPIRQRATARRACPRISECSRRRQHLQGDSLRGKAAMASGSAGRKLHQPRGVLRSECELELRSLWAGVDAVQSAEVDSVGDEADVLTRRLVCDIE